MPTERWENMTSKNRNKVIQEVTKMQLSEPEKLQQYIYINVIRGSGIIPSSSKNDGALPLPLL
jgi:hypothetical protein